MHLTLVYEEIKKGHSVAQFNVADVTSIVVHLREGTFNESITHVTITDMCMCICI